ncbi:MAG: hypothetical protein M0D57_18475 [Sphingobacteriales bacterium JAD_PAG50586_3]|nr:MAG: hypothetical protein M0D57_18475 [Sphingobacteriales bacterium JAD_PAG50586_3]
MKKDIKIPPVKDVAIAIVKDSNEADQVDWYVYLINMKDKAITDVIINSKGYGTIDEEQIKTSTLRHYFAEVKEQSFVKIEVIMDSLFGLNNEFWVSFYIGKQIYDQKFVFLPETIKEENFTLIPLMDKRGVMIGH